MSMFDPENSERNDSERAVAGAALVVAGSQAAELLAATDSILHPMPQPVAHPIKRPGAVLVGLVRDGDPDSPAPADGADGPAAVAFVAGHTPWALAGPAAAWALDRALRQQPLEDGRLVRLARGEHHGHRLATALA